MNAFTKHNPPALLLKDAMVATCFSVGGPLTSSSGTTMAPAASPATGGSTNSVATIQVQPSALPGRPSSAFDFSALGLMAKIIGIIYFISLAPIDSILICILLAFMLYRISASSDATSGQQESYVRNWNKILVPERPARGASVNVPTYMPAAATGWIASNGSSSIVVTISGLRSAAVPSSADEASGICSAAGRRGEE